MRITTSVSGGTGEADPLLELHVGGFGTHDWGPAPAAGGKDRRLPAAPDGQHLEVPKTGAAIEPHFPCMRRNRTHPRVSPEAMLLRRRHVQEHLTVRV
jgi:hypothetical protein